MKRAHRLMAEKRYGDAGMTAMRVVYMDPQNIEATQMVVKLLESAGENTALVWRQRLLELQPEVLENRVALAELALKMNDSKAANAALIGAGEAAAQRADFQHLSGRVAAARKDALAAEMHYQRAVELEPQNEIYQLDLAIHRLQSSDITARVAAQKDVEKLAVNPAMRRQALQALFQEASRQRDLSRAVSFAAAIAELPGATFQDRLPHLATLRRLHHPDFEPTLQKAQTEAMKNPDDLRMLLDWMNGAGMADRTLAWNQTLPAEIMSTLPVPIAVAHAHLLSRNWAELKVMVDDAPPAPVKNWGRSEFLRHAFLSRVAREQGDPEKSAEDWKNAVRATHYRSDDLRALAQTAAEWRWMDEATSVLWTAVDEAEQPEWALDQLQRYYRASGSTRQLLRVASKVLERKPNDPTARNNVAALSLLIDFNAGDALKVGAELYKAYPSNRDFITTYAFALHHQGQTNQGLDLCRSLDATSLAQPAYAAYFGVLLAAAGQREEARKYLTIARTAPPLPNPDALLPEEAALVEQAFAHLEEPAQNPLRPARPSVP